MLNLLQLEDIIVPDVSSKQKMHLNSERETSDSNG